ncbi:MAG: hypothetical protein L0215_15200 [Gemmataceae bacterium]|nr:hypothetical protein [Gemmataceae bacterium]
MSLDVGRYRLYTAHQSIQERWDEARIRWLDVVREDFVKQYLYSLEPLVNTTLGAIDRLAQVLIRAKQECG